MVIHELGHLLGLWHEHARTDRDNNVLVLINNVGLQYQHNFEKVRPMRLLAPYDISSMMHYTMNVSAPHADKLIDTHSHTHTYIYIYIYSKRGGLINAYMHARVNLCAVFWWVGDLLDVWVV